MDFGFISIFLLFLVPLVIIYYVWSYLEKKKLEDSAKTQDLTHNTKTILGYDNGTAAIFDNKNKQWEVIPYSGFFGAYIYKKRKTFRYSDIVSFELLENGSSTVRGGVGSALVGGILFGGVGAIVGASAGSKTVDSECLSLIVKVTVNNPIDPTVYITIFEAEGEGAMSTTSSEYKKLYRFAHDCLSTLQLICESQESKKDRESRVSGAQLSTNQHDKHSSNADEILKYKKLLDEGIITSTEFDNKKKQLLGLENIS